MFFRRDRPKKITFEDYVEKLKTAGFETRSLTGGRVKAVRDGIAAVIEPGRTDGNADAEMKEIKYDTGVKPQLFERAGVVLGDEIGTLVDGGFQKFFRTPSGVRKPAVAAELKAVHDFEEDLREVLGLTSLYNQSLGSVSNLYLYDRVKGRDSDAPKKPWEKTVRAEDSVEKI